MPPFPGEDRLLTLFADVHYYFTIPTPNPAYHRFDKGSYLYVYHDAVRGSARLEIANNPGTSEQDAFNGAVDKIHVVHSTRFHTLCTVTVGTQVEGSPVSTHSHSQNQDQWILPFTDPHARTKRNLRLHTLDIYFWSPEDADQFLDALERVLPPQQVESDRHAHDEVAEEPSVSRVVEQLETVAITDPAYQNGQTKDSRPEPANPTPSQEPAPQTDTANYTPLAYNPAAPAAPEPIKAREKTPPPEDGQAGTGLAAAAMADHAQPYAPTQTSSSFSQPPSYVATGTYNSNASILGASPNQPGPPVYSAIGVASPPPTQAAGMSFAPPPQNPNAHLFARDSYDSQQSQTPPQQQVYKQHAHHPHHPQYADYLQQTQGHANPHAEPEDPRVAIAGYSNYSYATQSQNQYGQLASEYDIHSRVYVPTEAELKESKHAHHPPKKGNKLEQGLGRMDSRVNGFLKRIEKKIG